MLKADFEEDNLGLSRGLTKRLNAIGEVNVRVICDYIRCLGNEIRLSENYKKNNVTVLVYLSQFLGYKKFKEMTKDDNLSYLNSIRKSETDDPLHGSTATYNLYLIMLTRFFKWLHYPDLSPKQRPRPSCIDNIPALKRREQSIYKPSDIWTQEDDILFLKYCPSKRDRCYHAISRDSSCRPHELLKLRIKDVVFKMTANGRQYAEVLVNGKTGQRHIPLINSIPYLKDWIDNHPQSGNPDSVLICGLNKSLGRSIRIESLNHIYQAYKKEFFPRLLNNPNVSEEDKEKISELLKKPWNPYIRRHSALTEKSKILKEHTLRQHAGWTATSSMHQKYLHYFGNESNESILEAFGLKPKLEEIDKLKPTQCPNCKELNKIDARFCSSCHMILSYDGYTEILKERENKQSDLQALQNELKLMREQTDDRITTEMEKFMESQKLNQEKLDDKIDELQRQFLMNNVRVGSDQDDERRPLTEEEIQAHLDKRRRRDNLIRKRDKRLAESPEADITKKYTVLTF